MHVMPFLHFMQEQVEQKAASDGGIEEDFRGGPVKTDSNVTD